jgi:hypothetical protein
MYNSFYWLAKKLAKDSRLSISGLTKVFFYKLSVLEAGKLTKEVNGLAISRQRKIFACTLLVPYRYCS